MEPNNYVYFVRNTETKKIKIGESIHPRTRIKGIQSKEKAKMETLLLFPCFDLEKFFHAHFKSLEIGHEWYEPGEELIDYILTAKASAYDEPEENVQLAEEIEQLIKETKRKVFLAHVVRWLFTFVSFVAFGIVFLLLILPQLSSHAFLDSLTMLLMLGGATIMCSLLFGIGITYPLYDSILGLSDTEEEEGENK